MLVDCIFLMEVCLLLSQILCACIVTFWLVHCYMPLALTCHLIISIYCVSQDSPCLVLCFCVVWLLGGWLVHGVLLQLGFHSQFLLYVFVNIWCIAQQSLGYFAPAILRHVPSLVCCVWWRYHGLLWLCTSNAVSCAIADVWLMVNVWQC